MVDFTDLNPIEPITRKHDRKSFVSGVSKLDNYLWDRAIGDSEKNISRIFVLTLKTSPETIVGYYSLSSLMVPVSGLAENIHKKLPNYKMIGATLLGKLAVAENWQRDKCDLRLGEYLLIGAMHTAWLVAQHVAAYALVVDILVGEKGDPTGFYTKNHFLPFQDNPMRMFLPMTIVERVLRESGVIL